MYHSIQIIGNLGNTPELRYTKNGTPVTSFNVAVNEKWNDRDGGKQERVTWYSVSVWNKMAEVCARYLSTGRQVFVEGRPGVSSWTADDGSPRAKMEISARVVQFLGSANRSDGGPSTPVDDDIPF